MRALLLLIPLTLAVAVVGTAAHETAAANVEAAVNRRLLVLPPHATVGEALLESRTAPHNGVLRSVVTHSVVDSMWHPGRVLLDDRGTRLDARVRSGDRIRVTNGADGVEGTVERDQTIQSPGGTLPDVEREVWTPGIDGMARAKVGERSGEVVQQETMQRPVAASRVPARWSRSASTTGLIRCSRPRCSGSWPTPASRPRSVSSVGRLAPFQTCSERSRNKATRSVTTRRRIR